MAKKMKVVFIAGPFRGSTAWAIELNARAAEIMALKVAEAGAMPFCPHTNTRFFHGQLSDQFWLDGIQEMLRRCDAVQLCGAWLNSSGTRDELELASELGMPVFNTIQELEQWLK